MRIEIVKWWYAIVIASAKRFAVVTPRPDRVDIAPVLLGLRMDERSPYTSEVDAMK